MTKQITKKSVTGSYSRIISVGYCGLQNLLWREQRRGYTAGIEGWNADLYVIDGVAIVTGYRPFGDRVPYELAEKYEKKAKAIMEAYRGKKFYTGRFEDETEKLHALAVEFVREAVKERE